MKKIILMLTLLGLPAFAGQEVGSGGDAVICKPSDKNAFSGFYSLDFLAQLSSEAKPVATNSLEESLGRIEAGLTAKIPELANNFKSYRLDLFNEKNFHAGHIWDKAPYGLVDLKDESLVTLLPENCRDGDKVRVVQAVIRMSPKVAGLPENKVNYKYVPQVIEELAKNNPLQLSFLIVHEWLWSFSNNVERNRRINYWLHSTRLESSSRSEWVENLNSIGFVIPDRQPPVWEPAICEYDQDTVDKIHSFKTNGAHKIIFTGAGTVFKRLTKCPKNKTCVGQPFVDSTESFRRSFQSQPKMVGVVQGQLRSALVFTPDQTGKMTPSNTLFSCSLWDNGTSDSFCKFVDGKKEFRLEPTVGKNCMTLRGQLATNNGDHNTVEQIVFYFSKVEWVE